MPPASLALILLSAVIHVLTHLAFKRSRLRLAFAWWLLLAASIIYLPLAGDPRTFPPVLWGIMIVSSLLDAFYFGAIGRAYAESDLSVVYPLARGSAPVFLVLWSALALREPLKWGGVAGILLIAFGLYTVNLRGPGRWLEPLRSLYSAGPRWALLAGLFISLYSAVDKIGVGYLPPLQYSYWVIMLSWLWLTPAVFAYHSRGELMGELRSGWQGIVVAGLATMAAYGIVLGVVRGGVPMAYAGAAREVSVVFGVLAGAGLLGETGLRSRILGAGCVVAGVAIIGLAG